MDSTGLRKQTHPKVFPKSSWDVEKQNRFWRDDLMLLTSDLLVQTKQNSHCKELCPPWRRLLYVLPTWALTSVKRNGPWTICVVITEGTISPPPRLRTCIPPIPPPSVQIVSTFMQVTGSRRSLSCCGRNQMSALSILKIQQIKDVFSLFTLIHLCMLDGAAQFNLLCPFCGNVKKDVSSSVSVPAHVWSCGQTTPLKLLTRTSDILKAWRTTTQLWSWSHVSWDSSGWHIMVSSWQNHHVLWYHIRLGGQEELLPHFCL